MSVGIDNSLSVVLGRVLAGAQRKSPSNRSLSQSLTSMEAHCFSFGRFLRALAGAGLGQIKHQDLQLICDQVGEGGEDIGARSLPGLEGMTSSWQPRTSDSQKPSKDQSFVSRSSRRFEQ